MLSGNWARTPLSAPLWAGAQGDDPWWEGEDPWWGGGLEDRQPDSVPVFGSRGVVQVEGGAVLESIARGFLAEQEVAATVLDSESVIEATMDPTEEELRKATGELEEALATDDAAVLGAAVDHCRMVGITRHNTSYGFEVFRRAEDR